MQHDSSSPDPSLGRRDFLALLGGIGSLIAAGNGWPTRALGAPTHRRSLLGGAPDLGSLVREDFEPLEGARLRVRTPDGERLQLRLIEVTALPSRGPRPQGRLPFSILLDGPSERLPQGVYRVSTPSLGEHDLLVTPVITRRSTPVYEVVFG